MNNIDTKIIRLLNTNNIEYNLLPHTEQVFTVEAAAAQRGVNPDEMVKSILLREKGGQKRYVMACVLGFSRLDHRKVRQMLGEDWKRLTFASKEEIFEQTGYTQGAVAPLCLPEGMPVVFDASIQMLTMCNISSGDLLAGIELQAKDLVSLSRAMAGVIVE